MQRFNENFKTRALGQLSEFKLNRANTLGNIDLFWQYFDQCILIAVEEGRCPSLWQRGNEYAVASNAIYQCQLELLDEITDKQPFPLKYSHHQKGLNRAFYGRQKLISRSFKVNRQVIRGVLIEIKN
jgi:hypothetical protein